MRRRGRRQTREGREKGRSDKVAEMSVGNVNRDGRNLILSILGEDL